MIATASPTRPKIRDHYATNDAIACAELGWRIVMLKHKRGERKWPREHDWANNTTLDIEQLIEKFELWPKSGFGGSLGPYPFGDPLPGMIDIEHDTDQGRATANRIFGDLCVTPSYFSKRSIHRLFLWEPWMPKKQKDETLGGLEIRLGGDGKQTHSVMPPSLHDSGDRYRWLPDLSMHDCELARVPPEIEDHLRRVAENEPRWSSPKVLPSDQWRRYSRREVECVRYMLSLCESKHVDDHENWFRLLFACKTIGGDALREDFLKASAKATHKRSRQRAAAGRKWDAETKLSGTASIHTIERIMFGEAMPADFWVWSGLVDFSDDEHELDTANCTGAAQ
ncbi:MAG: bifunctional DNA primase/polymerase [Rubripirellula sp.]